MFSWKTNGILGGRFDATFMENKRVSRRRNGLSRRTRKEKGIKQPVGYLIPFFVLSETRCKDSAFLEDMQIKV